MLEKYFESQVTLERLRSSSVGAYIDGFAAKLKGDGYAAPTARSYLYSASHLGGFMEIRGTGAELLEEKVVEQFREHLPCDCPRPRGGKLAANGAAMFYDYLRSLGVLRVASDKPAKEAQPPVVESFRCWLEQHLGAAASTRTLYSRGAAQLVSTLGEDPTQYDAQNLRDFILQRAGHLGRGATQALIKSLRSFLRYLATEGRCSAALEQAIPSVAGWRVATLPRYLTSGDVERTLASCEPNTVRGIRDRAVLLQLVRLGLRASDVAGLRLFDFDWEDATVLVSGKTRREARLPLSQEVGDAVLQYLECRPEVDAERVFLRVRAPWRPLSSAGVSSIARRAMIRASVSAPSLGAHILRHTAATQMLREGLPLDDIRTVLRHRSVDMTATYAKVDIELLQQVAQPWPEVLRCL